MKTDLVDQAKKTIAERFFLNIASVGRDYGQPWNTPVYFTFDQKYNFYWTSAREAVHSQNINSNSSVFITIYEPDEMGVGVYIEAEATELDNEIQIIEVLKIMDRTEEKTVRDPKNYLNESPLRIYKAIPKKVSVSTPETASKYNGLWVDKRIDIVLG